MSTLTVFLRLGFHHIIALDAWDHLLFVAALTAVYGPRDWRRMAVLVTAFTLGHSVTLALASFDVVRVSSRVVEPLIAATIVLTALAAISDQLRPSPEARERFATNRRYATAVGFGLIHGLGFASGLHALLGADEAIAVPLLGFNLGLEAGQILVVSLLFAINAAAEQWLRMARRTWVLGISALAVTAGVVLIFHRL